jgi:hypothetical protein
MADNDFNPATTSTSGETPTLNVVLQAYIDAAMRNCHVWMPATVLTVTPGGTTQVSVQPTLLRTFTTLPAPVPLPPLQNVPVVYPRGASYGVKLPVAIGDSGIVLFCDRSLDIWKAQATPVPAPVNPQSQRYHDLSDGVFIPGVYPLSTPTAPQLSAAGPLDLALYNGLAQFFMQPDGAFLQGNGVVYNGTLLVETLTALVSLSTTAAAEFTALAAASTGPLAPLAAGFTALATAFTTAAGEFTTYEAGFTALAGEPGA